MKRYIKAGSMSDSFKKMLQEKELIGLKRAIGRVVSGRSNTAVDTNWSVELNGISQDSMIDIYHYSDLIFKVFDDSAGRVRIEQVSDPGYGDFDLCGFVVSAFEKNGVPSYCI